jgi:pSer/pThr/pTyr-binding forkhead associated (FHA) protein
MFAGALGGLTAWAIAEPFAPRSMPLNEDAWRRFEAFWGMGAGLLIGLAIGLVAGLFQGSRGHAARGAIIGALVGLICGPLGINIGSALFGMLGGGKTFAGSAIFEVVARVVGWAAFGAFIGLGEGFVGRSVKRGVQGMVGGLLGGAVGGLGFQAAALVFAPVVMASTGTQEVGQIPRAVGLVCVGAGIGLMIGIVEALGRKAWVRIILGRNEGRDIPIDMAQTAIGRSELAGVPLFGDANIAPLHATIVKQGGQYWLHDAGTPIGTGLNGQRLTGPTPLGSGDMIQIASMSLQFVLRDGGQRRIPMQSAVPIAELSGAGSNLAMPAMPQPRQPVGASPMRFRLRVASGPLSGQSIPLGSPVEIGREVGNPPLSFDAAVSRRHAAFALAPDGVQVTDLGSTNGTLVNGQKIQSILARMGDQIQIGATIFLVEPETT